MLLLKDCDKNDLSDQIQAALAHIADGVCHVLKVRVETILNGCNDLIILYSVSNLIRFYQAILKQVNSSNRLSLDELKHKLIALFGFRLLKAER